MANWLGYYLGLLMVFSCYADSSSTTLPSGVVKVNQENNIQCVEYLIYKGALYCSPVVLGKTSITPELLTYEKQNIHFDQRVWKAAWGKKTDAVTTVEYIPVGDTIDHWHELITSQYMPNLKDTDPQVFLKNFTENLKKTGATYTLKTIEQKPEYLIFEFKVTAPANMLQDELEKVTKGKDGLYLLHYAVRYPEMLQADRQKWIDNLKASTIKK